MAWAMYLIAFYSVVVVVDDDSSYSCSAVLNEFALSLGLFYDNI